MANTLKNTELDSVDVSSKEIEEVREKLGDTAKDMTDEQLRDQIAMMKYLSESWLDDYERTIFDGKTLNEVLDDKV